MPRVLCVWFPKWPIQRLWSARPERKRSEIVLFAGRNQRPVITNCSTKAERMGLRIGQPLAEAKALLPKANFLPADVDADRSALAQLALDCQCFSPLVGLEESAHPESLLSEVIGCTHLWDGEERFLQAVRGYWRGRGYQIHVSLAGTVGAAWALAHTATISLVPAGNEEEALSDLPMAALRLPPAALERLEALGLTTIGEVLRLPRETLASRFGVILPQRLDQALGLLPETFVCERLKEPLSAAREWEVPIDDRFAVVLVSRQMLRELLSMADRHGMGLHELEGEIRTETGPVKIEIRLVEPTRDDQHLAQLAELELERRTWTGGVVAVRWAALRLGRLEQAQRCWFGDGFESKTSRALNTLVDRLSSRLEARAVLRAEVLSDSQPEHVVRLVPWTNDPTLKTDRFTLPAEQSRGRPFRLLGIPQPIEVSSIVPDGPPYRMVWQRQDCLVVRSWGPERIATGWWRAQDIERDYYRAEWEDGTQVWVYRDQRNGRWYLHGFFD
ncbi:MAG: Y-family DNA polymerase [Isosphaerales bacterium]